MKRLIRHTEVKGILRVKTGLRIGAGRGGLEIGGLDSPIMRHPQTRVPYVPGSSIKGKLRSLLEQNGYKIGNRPAPELKDGPCGCNKCAVCWLFGCGDARSTTEPTRLIFRDCPLVKEDVEKQEELIKDGLFYSEVKHEVTMDRITGAVGRAGPRSMDRIIAGTGLDFSLTVRVFEGDLEPEMLQSLLAAFKMLIKEGLGGSTTRGYGKVRFENLKWGGEDITAELHPEAVEA